ncbi:MAG: 3-deoxy-D-manno-octulosonic acid transferase [Methylococcaceae bacterium]|nr:MAG: 3-deoxy-D-manno-octulosonic acid transferase [Methylococcaceae bacterium]
MRESNVVALGWRLLYSALFYLASPFLVLRLWLKGRTNPAYRRRWRERFGLQDYAEARKGGVWLHAVSVGETEAAAPLLNAMRAEYPGIPMLVTTTTPTGSARVTALFGDSVQHVYLPYDLPDAVQRFMEGYRPRLAVFMETEIWPNLFAGCAARNVPLVIVNARLSERSCKGYRRLAVLVSATLSAVHAIAAQTAEDAARFASLGVAAERLHVLGNLKFDRAPAPGLQEQGQALRRQLFGNRPVWIAASTHPGEEEQILAVQQKLLASHPDVLLILAPRHPERAVQVVGLLKNDGMRQVRRSDNQVCPADCPVYLLDSLGELNLFYTAADIAFVGGSLVPVGGHNVLEPAVLGLPVLFGPHMSNFADIAQRLLQAESAIQVQNGDQLQAQLERLWQNAPARQRLGARASEFVVKNQGALQRHMALLKRLLATLK